MQHLRYIIILSIGVFTTSCTSISKNMSWTGLVIMSLVMLGIFGYMFYLIFKRRRQGEKSLSQFSANIHQMLEKFEYPESKIGALENLIKRINEDPVYKKDTVWRDQVLAKTYLHLATQYHSMGDMDNTLKTCTKILELTPDDAMTLYNRGSIYSNKGEYNKAITDLNRSIELVDNYGSSYNNRGTILSKLGRQEEALIDFDKALSLEQTPIIYLNKGNTLKDMGKVKEALDNYNKALEIYEEFDENLKNEILTAINSLKN